MVLDGTVVIVGAINLLALGAAYGSLRQEVKDLSRRIGRLEACHDVEKRDQSGARG